MLTCETAIVGIVYSFLSVSVFLPSSFERKVENEMQMTVDAESSSIDDFLNEYFERLALLSFY
jgi:hypothetical protein